MPQQGLHDLALQGACMLACGCAYGIPGMRRTGAATPSQTQRPVTRKRHRTRAEWACKPKLTPQSVWSARYGHELSC